IRPSVAVGEVDMLDAVPQRGNRVDVGLGLADAVVAAVVQNADLPRRLAFGNGVDEVHGPSVVHAERIGVRLEDQAEPTGRAAVGDAAKQLYARPAALLRPA